VIPAGLIAFEPLTEWVIHVYLLHARPIRVRGRSYDLLAAREHRAHHGAPTELEGVLVPTYALFLFVPAIAGVLFAGSFALEPLIGGDRVAWWLTGVVAGYAILLSYEWCHFLIHYKNEHFWFGVTSNLGDVVLRTNPEQSVVAKSPTARTLGGDEVGSASRGA
jgi:hypothetical protein